MQKTRSSFFLTRHLVVFVNKIKGTDLHFKVIHDTSGPHARALPLVLFFCLVSVVIPLAVLHAADGNTAAFTPSPGTIGLVITEWSDALVETPKAEECSLGLQKDDIEQFKATPDHQTHLQTIGGNYLLRGPHGETGAYSPMSVEDPLPFSELTTKIGYGLNLDGTEDGHATPKTCKHEKFTSPEGVKVDNQVARVLGCVLSYRTGGHTRETHNDKIVTSFVNRHLIEITGVDDEKNDPSVEVSIYKGRDRLVRNGNDFIRYQSQRIDERYPNYNLKVHGRIVDGVLITDPLPEATFPRSMMAQIGERDMRDVVLRLKLTDAGAEGIMAGYESLRTWWHIHDSSVITGAGHYSLSGIYRAMHRYADGYPDPKTGECTYISATYNIKAVRAIIAHAPPARARVANAQ